ncbi:hypothetical protein [Stutzerimonas nitrititolerans]|uniref:hypothetical protein n=1 Tax=Stutzerimonas nitrititolerans TaxID=2482751 RepID=UPI0028A9F7E3|nr:hypothetical protein [Stutzerimonas nitrititolerans]
MNVKELKALAEAVRDDNATYGDPDMYEPRLGLSGVEAEFAKAANPAAILKLIEQNEALAGLYKMHQETETREMRELRAEVETLKAEASSLRGSCRALGDENKRLSRRARALHRAVTWFASTGWGVKRPVWLERILAKEVANG